MAHEQPAFRESYTRLAPVFLALNVCLGAYLWICHDGFLGMMHYLFPCMVPLLVGHALAAFIRTLPPAQQTTWVADDGDDGIETVVVNPGTGAPMIGGVGGVDAMGYMYGNGPDD